MAYHNNKYNLAFIQPLPDTIMPNQQQQQLLSQSFLKVKHSPPLSPASPPALALAPAPQTNSNKPTPPMNKIAEFSAQMICYLWFAEPNTRHPPFLPQCLSPSSSPSTSPSSSTSPPSITQAQLVPNPEFVMFIHNLLNTTQVSHSVVLLALFYIHRLKSLNPIKPNSKSEYRIGVVSLMLANKMLDDHTYTAKTWSEVSRLPLNSLNDGEIEFLKGLNFELHVNICDFSAWFKLLHGMVHLKDRHTAIALASGPRTRWFKKMRVASEEGLSVLEGLVSPIRNSKIMKTFEVEKQRAFRAPPPRREHLEPPPSSRFQAPPIRIQPSHPYNLRRSTRPMVVSSTHTTPIQQFPRWDGSPSSVSSAYSAIVPCNALSMTPQQQMEWRDRAISSLPPKTRSIQYPATAGYPTRVNTTKRNLTEFLTSQQDSKLAQEEGLNSRNKRLSSSISTSTTSSSSSRIPSATTTIHTTPSSQQLLHHQLAPILSSTPATTTHASYLANAIIPSVQHQHQQQHTNIAHETQPKLCFRSIVAGRRGGNEQVVVARHDDGSRAGYMVGNNNTDRFVMTGPTTPVGSLDDMNHNKGKRGNWFYSNFSNAGVPGVVWADRAANSNHHHRSDDRAFLTVVPPDHMDPHTHSHPPHPPHPPPGHHQINQHSNNLGIIRNNHHHLVQLSSDDIDDHRSRWHLNRYQLQQPF